MTDSADSARTTQAPPLDAVLAREARRRRVRIVTWSAIVLLVAAGIATWLATAEPEAERGPTWVTEPAEIGTLVVRVSATGNLKPTNQVEVGSEISGIVTEVLVDANDQVTRGQVLLVLDTARLEAALATSRAGLRVARAQVEQAEAADEEARHTLERLQELHRASDGRTPSALELEQAESTARRAHAALTAARASVTQVEAGVESDATSLEKATIRSPIDGVVLSRNVEPGQTVAATFQAPVLFTIAEDLAQMELEVAIDEADVGQVAPGQPVTFTVDAWPGRVWEGEVARVGLGAQEVDGVVSYPALIAVRNDDLRLRPGMTATAEIVTLTRDEALLVPNAALRFDPTATVVPRASSGGLVGRIFARPSQADRPTVRIAEGRHVWVLRDGEPVQVEVTPGASNGRVTEVEAGTITPGTPLIVESAQASR